MQTCIPLLCTDHYVRVLPRAVGSYNRSTSYSDHFNLRSEVTASVGRTGKIIRVFPDGFVWVQFLGKGRSLMLHWKDVALAPAPNPEVPPEVPVDAVQLFKDVLGLE